MSAKGRPQRPHFQSHPRTNLSWQEKAACIDADPRIFFDSTCYAQALLVCRECEVKPQCNELARGQTEGVRGGRVHGQRPGRPKRVRV